MSEQPARRRRIKPTAKTVAERARVSVTTVSRVMNGRDTDISPETRRRVLEVAHELRYRPSTFAGGLRRGYSRTVGLIVPDISDAYFHQIARGIEDVAQPAGYSVILCNTDRVAAKERSAIEALYDQNVDAIVFAGGGVDDDRHLRDLPWDFIPVVTVGPHRLPFPSIRVDDAGTIRLAMHHLFDQGRKRILCITGNDNWLVSSERTKGYREALQGRGIPYDPELVFTGDFSVEAGQEAIDRAVERGLEFDAVMAFNDYSAVGAITSLERHGLSVPDDISVVGCDDIQLAALFRPSLTSVSFPQREFGAAAMTAVLRLVSDDHVEPVTEFDYKLEIRESSGGPGDTNGPRQSTGIAASTRND